MKTLFTSLFIGIASILYLNTVSGRGILPYNSKPETSQLKESAAGCLPAFNYAELNINNVRARINSGGDMWWDLSGLSKYEIPKGSGRTSMFAAAMWIGGIDINGSLKLAAQRYRGNGNDFWTGPLSVDGTASIDASTCNAYDMIFTTYRKDIVDFIAYRSNPAKYPQYQIPDYFFTYPAHGDQSLGQSYYLAPFYDKNEDGNYNPLDGDYPYYDINNNLCHQNTSTAENEHGITNNGMLSDQVLKGDQNLWWVFNDKGNTHTETHGTPIGLEIRAQAFAFTSTDEINNATFYSYEIINRSSYDLFETYIASWNDPDLGGSKDDYIGCDVFRGLGYCYNGDNYDEDSDGAYGYGDRPAAVGVDFFQGPYLDADGYDNPALSTHLDSLGNLVYDNCNEAVNGVNFGNGIIDDERYGMEHFLYHNGTTNGAPEYMTDPDNAPEYYNFLGGIWKENSHMIYGGNGHVVSGGYGPECDYMFPGMSDFCNKGTHGIEPYGPKNWTEETAGNLPNDRRFMQSAGPFTMKAGSVNYITIGVPWARACSGGPQASLSLLKYADDKCQALFDNCFQVLDGPDAPDLSLQELDRELILYLTNEGLSNNAQEDFEEYDPSIDYPDSLRYDSLYHFEGYQIFQVTDINVTSADLHDVSKARLVAQCDIQNNISTLINYYYSEELAIPVPQLEVEGENEGLVHSFRILEDQFAVGDNRLINNKKYYYLVVAYAYNEFEKFSQDPSNQFPGEVSVFGQQRPYLSGRTNVKVYTAIPHIPAPEANGTLAGANYGSHPKITRIEGQGNGGFVLELVDGEREQIFTDNFKPELTYKNGYGPVDVKVIDPLNVRKAQYILRIDSTSAPYYLDSCKWILEEYDMNGNYMATFHSYRNITQPFEQIFPELGISVNFVQAKSPGDNTHPTNGFLEATIEYSNPNHPWLSGVPDMDGPTAYNWIRSGNVDASDAPEYNDYRDIDYNENYEKILGGTWAPYRLVSNLADNPGNTSIAGFQSINKMKNLASVDIVFTPDKSKWSRCPVIETCDDFYLSEGGEAKYSLRNHASVDKDGVAHTTEANYDGKVKGMGWFPGYAVNVETGERLNVIFGENSWLVGQNGRDMILNPNSEFESLTQILFGGEHFIYVFGHIGDSLDVPAYDEGDWIYNKLLAGGSTNLRHIFTSAMWVTIPMLTPGETWLSNECRIRIRVSKPYTKNYSTYGSSSPLNNNYPMYRFNTSDLSTTVADNETARTALDLINVVPNPYYASGGYEDNVFENKIKITNVPSTCTVSIYTIDGVLIRQFKNSDRDNTTIEWDLTNFVGTRISGGLYLIHVSAPGIGERSIKWFGSLRAVTVNSF